MPDKKIPMIGISPPMVGEAGKTGTWRNQRPVIDPKLCLTCREKPRPCQLCWMYCPEICIEQGQPPIIDYDYCKGCGICAKECPVKAIKMIDEGQE